MTTKAPQSPLKPQPQPPTQSPSKPQKQQPAPVQPPPPPKSHIELSQQLSNTIIQKLKDQITAGSLPIRQKSLHIQLQVQKQQDVNGHDNPEKSIREKISSLHLDLEELQKQMAMQKEEEKVREEAKRRQAREMIDRLKKQKEEYRSKLKLNQMSSRLKNSVLSEDVLKLMRQRRDSLIQQKKRDMQLRIYKNLNRRIQREQDQTNNEIEYWQKVQKIEDRKRHHSTKILPSIHNLKHSSQQPKFGVNLQTIDRKNSHKVISLNAVYNGKQSQLGHKRSFSKQDLTQDADYLEIVGKFLKRAQARQMESQSQKIQGRSRLNTYQIVSEKNQSLINSSRIALPLKNEKIQKIVGSYIDNKRKLLGDQYLKQSLLRVSRSRSPKSPTLQDSQVSQSLQLKGNSVLFHRNNKLTNYQQRRDKIFQLLLSQKLDKARAIQMLNPIQSMLDRLNPEGIEQRLKEKLDVFSQFQKICDERDRERQARRGYEDYEDSQQII